jgi:hypothetical protein
VIYGITYVDHRYNQKAVFNGSELGKGYSAKAILERCAYIGAGEGKKQIGQSEKAAQGRTSKEGWKNVNTGHVMPGDGGMIKGPGLIETLLEPEFQPDTMDWNFKRKKKKKKRPRVSPD